MQKLFLVRFKKSFDSFIYTRVCLRNAYVVVKLVLSKNLLNWVTGVVYRDIKKQKTPVFNIYLNKILYNTKKKRGLRIYDEFFKKEISPA